MRPRAPKVGQPFRFVPDFIDCTRRLADGTPLFRYAGQTCTAALVRGPKGLSTIPDPIGMMVFVQFADGQAIGVARGSLVPLPKGGL